ncbi:type II toxin-antitoxin system VapC family toxin [Ghiorsea bivora]|uniref:type II toxin-antitoxin system VapC family toxin n=1 Tax=Ghiorsea bivora TaxID=1485545 RepID=UPI000570F926|nr:type II toxin-antitoxin system VapC family toxin [Ghiorsea bivora]
MIILDSSCWLEYFSDGKNAETYAPLIENHEEVIVPAIVLHEVFKVVMRATSEESALSAAGVLQQFPVIPIDENIAMYAAKLGQTHKLAMADSLILATAFIQHAELWTQDADFKGLASVRYFKKD